MSKAELKAVSQEDVTQGSEPLLGETPKVVIEGQEYTMRRLGIQDTFRMARIIAGGAAGLGQELGNMKFTAESMVMLFIAGVPYNEKAAMELLASIIGVKPDELQDTARFPMGSELEIITALAEHQDLKGFFNKFGRLLASPALKGFLSGAST